VRGIVGVEHELAFRTAKQASGFICGQWDRGRWQVVGTQLGGLTKSMPCGQGGGGKQGGVAVLCREIIGAGLPWTSQVRGGA